MSAVITENPVTAIGQLDRLQFSGRWSDNELAPIWVNAKRQLRALDERLLIAASAGEKARIRDKIAQWTELINRLEPVVTSTGRTATQRTPSGLEEARLSPAGLTRARTTLARYGASQAERAEAAAAGAGDDGDGDDEMGDGDFDLDAELSVAMGGRGRARGPVAVGPLGPATSLLSILGKLFGTPVPFLSLAPQTRSLYPLIWELKPADRVSFIQYTRRTELTVSTALTDNDKSLLGAWFIELFRKTYENSTKPSTISFTRNFMNPAELSAPGQLVLLTAIHTLFFDKGRHAGGVSTSLVLRSPNWDRLLVFSQGLAERFRHPPEPEPPMVPASSVPGGSPRRRTAKRRGSFIRAGPDDPDYRSPLSSTADNDDDDEGPPPRPTGVLSSSSAPTPMDVSSASTRSVRLLIPIDPELLGGALTREHLDGITVREDQVAAAIYARRLLSSVERWMVNPDRSVPTVFVPNPDERRDGDPVAVQEEQTALKKLRDDYTAYVEAKRDLLAVVQLQRSQRRLLMSDATHDELLGYINTIEDQFVGLYRAKADLMMYLNKQLTGSRPRDSNANHLLGTGEPGTGKTTLMEIVAYMMLALQLVDPPTLESYNSLGRILEQNITAEEYNKISQSKLPDKAGAGVSRFIGKPTYFALQAAVANSEGDLRVRPTITDPGKFQSVYTGGIVVQFLISVLRSLGSTMIIDEAYELRGKEYTQLVTQFVALVTQLRTQWSSVMLGYEKEMEELMKANKGLQRRSDTTIRFGFYTAIELVAITINEISSTDNLVLAASEDMINRIAVKSDAADPVVRDTLAETMTSVYNNMAPYAMRGTTTLSSNVFGESNVGAVKKLVGAIGVGHSVPFKFTPTMRFVPPDYLLDAMQAAAKPGGRRFGDFIPKSD